MVELQYNITLYLLSHVMGISDQILYLLDFPFYGKEKSVHSTVLYKWYQALGSKRLTGISGQYIVHAKKCALNNCITHTPGFLLKLIGNVLLSRPVMYFFIFIMTDRSLSGRTYLSSIWPTGREAWARTRQMDDW